MAAKSIVRITPAFLFLSLPIYKLGWAMGNQCVILLKDTQRCQLIVRLTLVFLFLPLFINKLDGLDKALTCDPVIIKKAPVFFKTLSSSVCRYYKNSITVVFVFQIPWITLSHYFISFLVIIIISNLKTGIPAHQLLECFILNLSYQKFHFILTCRLY